MKTKKIKKYFKFIQLHHYRINGNDLITNAYGYYHTHLFNFYILKINH